MYSAKRLFSRFDHQHKSAQILAFGISFGQGSLSLFEFDDRIFEAYLDFSEIAGPGQISDNGLGHQRKPQRRNLVTSHRLPKILLPLRTIFSSHRAVKPPNPAPSREVSTQPTGTPM